MCTGAAYDKIADFFIHKEECSMEKFSIHNICIWIIGFILYRILMRADTPIGSTLPDTLITIVICIVVNKLFIKKKIYAKYQKNPNKIIIYYSDLLWYD